jgi:hypothetical protein
MSGLCVSSDSRGATILTIFSSVTETQNQSNIMQPENLDIESITDARRKAVEQTI